jgi:MFS family permease
MHARAHAADTAEAPPTGLTPLLVLTFLCSIGNSFSFSGIYFVLEHDYAFTQTASLAMAASTSFSYMVVAIYSGHFTRWVTGRFGVSHRWVLCASTLAQVLGAVLAATAGLAGVIICMLIVNVSLALLWPIIEAYLSAGRHGRETQRTVGRFNIVWSACERRATATA